MVTENCAATAVVSPNVVKDHLPQQCSLKVAVGACDGICSQDADSSLMMLTGSPQTTRLTQHPIACMFQQRTIAAHVWNGTLADIPGQCALSRGLCGTA